MHSTPSRRSFIAGSLLAAAHPLAALAADPWPSKPVRFIVPFPPGGPVDTTARAASLKLSEIWKTPTVIDNRAGAGGVVGAQAAAREAPDGYTLFMGAIHHSVNPTLMGNLPYDIEKDFAPVSFGAMFPVFIVAHPSVPANTLQELIALATGTTRKGAVEGDTENGYVLAGMSLTHLTKIQPVEEIVEDLVSETERRLAGAKGLI